MTALTKAVALTAEKVNRLLTKKERVLVAVDGRCAAGKTTFSAALSDTLCCPVFHLDDFFLRPEQRTSERMQQPDGNVDYERFFSEVLQPLVAGQPFSYRPYDCATRTLKPPVFVPACQVAIIEGAYACCPSLCDYYDLRLFLDVAPSVQKERLLARNATKWPDFESKWIPLEERYHQAFSVKERCDLVFSL